MSVRNDQDRSPLLAGLQSLLSGRNSRYGLSAALKTPHRHTTRHTNYDKTVQTPVKRPEKRVLAVRHFVDDVMLINPARFPFVMRMRRSIVG